MRYLVLVIVVLLAGCMTKAEIRTETILDDGTTETCQATYLNFKDSATMDIGACGGGGKSEGATSNTVLMELLLRGLQAQN